MALKLKADPDNFLSAVQVGITLIGIVNGAYGGITLAADVVPFLKNLHGVLLMPKQYPLYWLFF